MNSFKKSELLTIGFMMFSIFFGAGNLIFPPALGQAAGTSTPLAMLGFLTTGVGLPLLGITAIALQGGRYIELINSRTYPWFATALLVVLYLCIGPVFAVPRTGAVSFEIGIRPFLQEDPNKLIDRVGKLLTPVLLIVLAVLFIKAFATPLGTILPATGNYIDAPFTQGFQDGYQTMDLLASVAIGTLVVNAVRMRGVTDNRAIGRICLIAGLITVTLMACVYGSLAYLGATSAAVLGHSANGGQLLASAVSIFFSTAGNGLLAAIIILACLTTSCGMLSGGAWFFNQLLKKKVSYERLLLLFTFFSFAVSNVGLTQIIALAVPFLVTIYPLVIVFVILSLFDRVIGWRKGVYRWALNLTLVFALIDGLNAAGIHFHPLNQLLTAYLPFYKLTMGWVVPAICGTAIGLVLSFFQKKEDI